MSGFSAFSSKVTTISMHRSDRTDQVGFGKLMQIHRPCGLSIKSPGCASRSLHRRLNTGGEALLHFLGFGLLVRKVTDCLALLDRSDQLWKSLSKSRMPRLRQHGLALRNDGANVAVEFALAAPVLILLLLASAELGRFVLLHQKVDRVAVTISDLVARAETISESELDDIFNAAVQVAEPFDLTGRGRVLVSSVINADGEGATVAWQRGGGGSFVSSSEIGVEGGSATLPNDFDVREGETAIISEVFFDFEPFLSSLIVSPQLLYRRAHHRPRLGTLDTIEAG